jgi:hypothetical protein|tara:strand:+ start:717 stop:896 length:180 start_codon:yes stop_codon:yes gene_type:complete
MRHIKFLKDKSILLAGVLYTPYMVSDLPQSFGFIYDPVKDQDGTPEWFNFKGLTYIIKK